MYIYNNITHQRELCISDSVIQPKDPHRIRYKKGKPNNAQTKFVNTTANYIHTDICMFREVRVKITK